MIREEPSFFSRSSGLRPRFRMMLVAASLWIIAPCTSLAQASLSIWGENHDDWSAGITFTSSCESDVPFALMLTTLGTDGVDDRVFRYSTARVAECDCPDYERLDVCLVGSWEMEVASDGVSRSTTITHGGMGTTTAKTEGGSGGLVMAPQADVLSMHG